MRWRRLDGTGTDTCSLRTTARGRTLMGQARFVHQDASYRLDYRVDLDAGFRTVHARVAGQAGSSRVERTIEVHDGQWRLEGRRVPSADGCLDVDLAFTPATNLLPIRRLGLNVGVAARVPAAWLRFPQFDLRRLDQTYRRVGQDAYDYRSGRFRARLDVDRRGFVTKYGGLWIKDGSGREARADAGARPRSQSRASR